MGNTPNIRFKGYTDDWEQRKLGAVVEDYVKKTTVEDQYPVLTSSQQKGIVLQDDYFSGDRVSQNGNVGYFIIPRGYFEVEVIMMYLYLTVMMLRIWG